MEARNIAKMYYDTHPQEQEVSYVTPTKWCKIHLTNTHSTNECRANKRNNKSSRNYRHNLTRDTNHGSHNTLHNSKLTKYPPRKHFQINKTNDS